MSSVQEIEAAIRALPAPDREILAEKLSSILPELNGDLEWERLINDPRPRPALSALADSMIEEFKKNPEVFPVIEDKDFDKIP